jgi:organic radical activating enzyme
MKVLRLILTRKCNRSCERCCNKQDAFVENRVPNILELGYNFSDFDTIILTGGEPLLEFDSLKLTIALIRKVSPDSKIIVYTANVQMKDEIIELLYLVDGITVTVHEQEDVDDFNRLNFWMLRLKRYKIDNNKTLRLNIFKGVKIYMQNSSLWKIKDNIEWIEDCPLPENEIIAQY